MPPSLSGLWASDLTSQRGTSCALVLHGNTDSRISMEQQPTDCHKVAMIPEAFALINF